MNTKVQFRSTFVNTRNVSNFAALMDALQFSRGGKDDGDERLGCVWGRAGRGKTRTIQRWAALNGAVLIETVKSWSELDFLKKICSELGVRNPAGRRGKAFADALEALTIDPKVVFVDEVERLGQNYLEIIRDLAKLSGGIFVLIGEEELPYLMKQNRRMWGRTYREMEFAPASAADVVSFVNQTTGLKLTTAAMNIIHKASEGDMRIIRRDTINLVHVVNSMNRPGDISADTAKIAVQAAMRG